MSIQHNQNLILAKILIGKFFKNIGALRTQFLIFVPTIINQSMSNTLNSNGQGNTTQQQKKHPNFISKLYVEAMFVLLVTILSILPSAQAKQTMIAESLSTKNSRIIAKLIQQTHSYIEYERKMSSINYQCKAILKNQLTKNIPENITRIQLHLDYVQVVSLKKKEVLLNYQPQEMQQIRRIDKILDILNGQCLYYQTKAFLYQYCHKEHVRQFDTHFTKLYNAKPQYEDISMGVYHFSDYQQKRQKKGITQLTPEQRKVTIPAISNFQKDYRFLYIQEINPKSGQIQVQESEDGNILYSNAFHIFNKKSLKQNPYFVKFTCNEKLNDGMTKQIQNVALLIDPYTFVYTKKKGKCDTYISHQVLPKAIPYETDQSPHPIRVYENYLYGKVEQICTKNWAWQKRSGQVQFDNNLEEGSIILIELFNGQQKKLQYHYVTIKKILTETLVQIDFDLGKSFRALPSQSDAFFHKSQLKSKRIVSNITKCQLLFKKDLKLQKYIKLEYLRNGIVKIGEESKLNNGDNIGCVCKSVVQNHFKIIDLDITIIKNLWQNYYQTLIKSNTNIYSTSVYDGKEHLLSQCQDFSCFILVQREHSKEPIKNNKKFTEIQKMTRRQPSYYFNSSNADNFYVLAIKGNGIIKLTTRSKDGLIYTYLLTEGQIIKIIEFANGTKQIIKENKYYENLTIATDQLEQNYIYIKINRLPNGSYYGGIWKIHDYIFFPRFTLFDEELISLERTSGYAYLRILNLDNMKNKQHLTIVAYQKKLESYYSMGEKLEADPSSALFLNKSYSISYYYVSGKYCDPPVNKFRKTTVTLKCGKSWYSISKLHQTSPCEYFIQIETALLCKEGFKDVLQEDHNLFSLSGDESIITNGVYCHPASGLFDEATPYLYMPKSVQ